MHTQAVQYVRLETDKIPFLPGTHFNACRLPFAACEYVKTFAAMQAAVVIIQPKADIITSALSKLPVS